MYNILIYSIQLHVIQAITMTKINMIIRGQEQKSTWDSENTMHDREHHITVLKMYSYCIIV